MKSLQARYLDRLAELYPTIAAASTEIINLESILNLPKGTEHFLTDIHGEYEAFSHVLKNGSGSVKRKIDDVFGNTLSRQDKQSLSPDCGLPPGSEQVHAFEDPQGASEGICLCAGRASD